MQQPLFVQTSEGLINLALVRYTTALELNDTRLVRFVFSSDSASADCVDLPEDEGNKIIRALIAERPELFLIAAE
jgi:hypothetical protein